MRILLAASLFLFGCSKTAVNIDNLQHPDSSYLPLIFLCGQSNMEGVSTAAGLPEDFTEDMKNVYVFNNPSNDIVQNGEIEQLKYGINNNWRQPLDYFGPEEGIGYYLSGEGHRVAIVKYAYGGSKLVFTNTPATNGYWQPNAVVNLNHYSILIQNWANKSLDEFRKAGFKPYIAAFIWCQGETDAHDLQASREYEKKLVELLNTFKKDMSGKDPNVKDMRVIITRTREGFPHSDLIRKAQEDIAKTYHNCYLINSDTWPLESDGIHFTANTQALLHGRAIADILEKVIP